MIGTSAYRSLAKMSINHGVRRIENQSTFVRPNFMLPKLKRRLILLYMNPFSSNMMKIACHFGKNLQSGAYEK